LILVPECTNVVTVPGNTQEDITLTTCKTCTHSWKTRKHLSAGRGTKIPNIYWPDLLHQTHNTPCPPKKLCKIVIVRTLSNFHQLW